MERRQNPKTPSNPRGAGRIKHKLTDRQELFCREYIKDLNALEAGKRAGYGKPGGQMLQLPHIIERIRELQAKRLERIAVSADWVLQRLAEEANADFKDIVDESGEVKNVHEWPEIWRKGLVTGLDITENTKTGERTTKLRMSDRIKRIELIGKHIDIGAFRDRVEHTGKDGGPMQHAVIHADMTPEDASRLYMEKLKKIG